jgi:membrane associated rhomboid family serine protease
MYLEEREIEKHKFFIALAKSLIMGTIFWIVFLMNDTFALNWNEWGMSPRTVKGLLGIITMHFLHADFEHLISNSLPLLFLGFGIFYYFPERGTVITGMNLLLTGIFTWISGRLGIHVGASGLVYALSFFLVTVSLIKMETAMLAYTLVIIFLYGSLVWGFFPQLFPDRHISWEGHLAGAVSGIFLAFFYRNEGPQKKKYFEDEELENNEYFENFDDL